ncbi:hypothetical protein I4I73_22035 [Pseudonocardia sp. KRD-184]|uniref:Integral membrane protein n=1 Tax=Pseudonocardia oceani TaxID=2792013 RepID=A0ABS6U2Y8_9PSEU|nr:hypothetical protein [Pseudonocardia oceani]MBW0092872.1 hypothetical protein [Pseudonocardia oceani]MBW0098671.1 hypothetical protein [Pseudonocardia oceani]MBW0121962.1 hypothetical protein [Pseudonocardia oceani]MBW0126484.1 hypothetical protein [Pseudonocardia oceani]
MDQPIFWGTLLTVTVLVAALRLRTARPLLDRRAIAVGRVELGVAGLSVLVLAFHCAAMFFGAWVDAIPGAGAPADAVRAMGIASHWAYWLPATILLLAWRRVWWPALALLFVALLGVGITMFWPYPLTTHLAWLAAAIVVSLFISTALLRSVPPANSHPGAQHPARTE